MTIFRLIFLLFALNLFSGCATSTTHIYRAGGAETICGDSGDSLGTIAVLPEMAWRTDQKEPEKRQEMALEEIRHAFEEIPCGRLATSAGIRGVAKWSDWPESKLLKNLSGDGIDTVIVVRIEELTPRVFVTYSLPFLWGSTSEADIRIRALSVKTGAVLADTRVKRSTGGPFHLRPAAWAGDELYVALKEIMKQSNINE